ncbi:hypothetical protein SRHO_G00301560 [Serrasalmus rhombeus]
MVSVGLVSRVIDASLERVLQVNSSGFGGSRLRWDLKIDRDSPTAGDTERRERENAVLIRPLLSPASETPAPDTRLFFAPRSWERRKEELPSECLKFNA